MPKKWLNLMKKINFILVILLFASQIQSSNAAQYQSIASIQKAITHYVHTHLTSSSDYKLKLGQIDNRLKLALCNEELTVFSQKVSLKAGRNSIGIKCNSNKKWTIYTSAIINIYQDVIVLSQPIKRGDFFTKNILQLEKREISGLRSGFFTETKNIINKQATRNLNRNTVLTQSNMTEPKLIKRGEKVIIKVNSPNLEISVAGIALMDGVKNQNIRIKNIKSKQIVQATVVKQGQVVVSY